MANKTLHGIFRSQNASNKPEKKTTHSPKINEGNTKNRSKCWSYIIMKLSLNTSSPALFRSHTVNLHRHPRMHIQQILRSRHGTPTILTRATLRPLVPHDLSIRASRASCRGKLRIRRRMTQTRCAGAALLHLSQHDVFIVIGAAAAVLSTGVGRAALADAGVHDEEEDEDGEGEGCVNEHDGAGLR